MGHGQEMKKVTEADILLENDPPREIAYLRARLAEVESELESMRIASGEVSEIVNAVRAAVATAKPRPLEYKPSKKSGSPCWHVLHITDIHYGMIVKRDEVDGFGEYNPVIAEQRLSKLAEMIIKKTEIQRNGYNVPYLRIVGTADYVSGDIHHELSVTNAFPCPRQAVGCGYVIGTMLELFARHFETVVADFVTLDNHGRITKRQQCAEGGVNNWSYVVAEVAAQYVRELPNVTVNIHPKPSALIHIGPERYLAFHGHQIRGWAGKPYYGFDRRVAMEAVKRMGVPESAFTKLLFGHFHHAFNGDYWMMGGSVSGTDAYDHSCGRHSRPHQTSWFVHPAHGEFDWTRWWL